MKTWYDFLEVEREKTYFKDILSYIKKEIDNGYRIYPNKSFWFNALKLTPLKTLKVVIIGQSPYKNPGLATGLAFSVPQYEKLTSTLENIFLEIKNDINIENINGDLTSWANQGVLLLNNILTVREYEHKSHANIGWETFTNNLINFISTEKENIGFLLWGQQAKRDFIQNKEQHLILETSAPSSANQGFMGNRHFSRVNKFLQRRRLAPIDWRT